MDSQREDLNWGALERLDWHLWVLAILLIFVLGVSLLSFMLPGAFWLGEGAQASPTSQRAFFGFCVLLGLVLVYLLQRQAVVRRLKRQLFEAQATAAAAERRAAIESFQTLPGTGQLRDALAMEYRRAAASGSHLAGALFTAPNASSEILGRLVNLLRGMLRRGESLYRISDKAVAVILPGMQLGDVASFVAQAEALSGISKEELEVSLTAYPDEAASLAELEARLRGGGLHAGREQIWQGQSANSSKERA